MTGNDVRVQVTVPLDPGRAFELFTAGIGDWWRDYWNDARANGIRFEDPGPGGRLVEVWDDGGSFEIGRVTRWEPGSKLAFRWRELGWPDGESNEVAVSFEASGRRTAVTLEHGGWDHLSESGAGGGYQGGWEDLLAMYATAAS